MMKVSIISLGRLGKKFYDYTVACGDEVVGSYHSEPKGLTGEVQYDFSSGKIPGELQDSDVLLFNLTPSTIQSIDTFKNFLKNIKSKRFIFITSTSVYGNQGEVDEATTPVPETDSGQLLYACEKLLLASDHSAVCIRPSGLYSDDFHPGSYMAGRELNVDGSAAVNLIHLDDLVEIISKAIETPKQIINATNSHHPSKEDYYTDYCQRNGLDLPSFQSKRESLSNKVVSTSYPEFVINSPLP